MVLWSPLGPFSQLSGPHFSGLDDPCEVPLFLN